MAGIGNKDTQILLPSVLRKTMFRGHGTNPQAWKVRQQQNSTNYSLSILRFKDKESMLCADHKLRGTNFGIGGPSFRQARSKLLEFATGRVQLSSFDLISCTSTNVFTRMIM